MHNSNSTGTRSCLAYARRACALMCCACSARSAPAMGMLPSSASAMLAHTRVNTMEAALIAVVAVARARQLRVTLLAA